MEVLIAAGYAPSAHNAQPWRFIILDDPEAKRRLSLAMAEAWAIDLAKDGSNITPQTRNAKVERFASAPVLILACTTMDGMTKQPDLERQRVERDLAVQSLGAALQNLLLAVHARGLGGCWYCAPAFCKAAVRSTVEIPGDVEPQALIALGYSAEKPLAPIKKQLGDFCFWDKWGGRC